MSCPTDTTPLDTISKYVVQGLKENNVVISY